MALPTNYPANEMAVTGRMSDVSTAGSLYLAAPTSGYLHRAYSCIENAITGADCTWTVEVNNVAVTGTVTITQSGSAAGDVDSITYPVHGTRVNAGDTIEFVSAGESSTTTPTHFTAVIRT